MSLSTHLAGLGLGKYTEKFKALGVELDQVLVCSPPELDTLMKSANMLKGHAVKFKKSITDLKKAQPDKKSLRPKDNESSSVGRGIPSPLIKQPVAGQSGVLDQIKDEISQSLSTLNRISEFKVSLDSIRGSIFSIDLNSFTRALDEIEALQNYYKSIGLSSSMEIES